MKLQIRDYRSTNEFCSSLVHVEEEVVLRELQNPARVGVSEAVEVAVVHIIGAVHSAIVLRQVVGLGNVRREGEAHGDEGRAHQDEKEHQD